MAKNTEPKGYFSYLNLLKKDKKNNKSNISEMVVNALSDRYNILIELLHELIPNQWIYDNEIRLYLGN